MATVTVTVTVTVQQPPTRSELIQKLEGKSMAMADTLQQLDAKFVESEKSCQVA